MTAVLQTAEAEQGPPGVAFNFDDFVAQADDLLAQARTEAAEIVAQAHGQSDAIRKEAAEQGCKAAIQAVEQMVAEQLAPALAAMQQASDDLHQSKQAWLAHWEASAVRVASAIAARVIRRELRSQPEITLTLVREALELAAGSPGIRLHLNPEDHKSIGTHVRTLVDSMSALGSAEVTADAAISRGGCRVETHFGSIDQQIESQLKRIEEELIG